MTPRQTQPFDMANHLRSEEEIAEYLRQVLQDNDPAELAGALGDIARARGMTQLACRCVTWLSSCAITEASSSRVPTTPIKPRCSPR